MYEVDFAIEVLFGIAVLGALGARGTSLSDTRAVFETFAQALRRHDIESALSYVPEDFVLRDRQSEYEGDRVMANMGLEFAAVEARVYEEPPERPLADPVLAIVHQRVKNLQPVVAHTDRIGIRKGQAQLTPHVRVVLLHHI